MQVAGLADILFTKARLHILFWQASLGTEARLHIIKIVAIVFEGLNEPYILIEDRRNWQDKLVRAGFYNAKPNPSIY
jgi:hypothetical protein